MGKISRSEGKKVNGIKKLFFYVVDEDKAVITVLRILNDGRDWMSIIKKWLRKHGTEK